MNSGTHEEVDLRERDRVAWNLPLPRIAKLAHDEDRAHDDVDGEQNGGSEALGELEPAA